MRRKNIEFDPFDTPTDQSIMICAYVDKSVKPSNFLCQHFNPPCQSDNSPFTRTPNVSGRVHFGDVCLRRVVVTSWTWISESRKWSKSAEVASVSCAGHSLISPVRGRRTCSAA